MHSIFRKTVLMIILLLLPIFVLYSISATTSTEVVRRQIESTNLSQLTFLMNQIDTNIEQLSMFPVLLSYDPDIRGFLNRRPANPFEALNAEYRIIAKLGLQSVSSGWRNDLSIILPQEKRSITSGIFTDVADEWQGPVYNRWEYITDGTGGIPVPYFIREIPEPLTERRREAAEAVFRVRFPASNITSLLDTYKLGKHNDPFFYIPGERPIGNSSSSEERVMRLISRLELPEPNGQHAGQKLIQLDSELYLVSFTPSEQLGGYLIDYVPYQSIIAPITEQRNFFYGIISLLLLLAVGASFLLYRNVQRPTPRALPFKRRMNLII